MKVKEIEALEGYFKTENEHWNGYAFEMLCEVLKQGNFENSETPLQLFRKAIDIFTEQYETPLQALQNFGKETDNKKLNPTQKLFVYEKVLDYLKDTDFDKADTDQIKDLLKNQIERLKDEAMNQNPEYNKPLVCNFRDNLKDVMQNELELLPATLKNLEPIQRLNILCKLMPYVMPKTESVKHNLGEPDEFKIKRWHD